MKKINRLLKATLFCMFLFGNAASFAATPKDINYASKGSSFTGGTYYIYNVRCSDGSEQVITAWDNRKNWCVGKSKGKCSNDQLKTAKDACGG